MEIVLTFFDQAFSLIVSPAWAMQTEAVDFGNAGDSRVSLFSVKTWPWYWQALWILSWLGVAAAVVYYLIRWAFVSALVIPGMIFAISFFATKIFGLTVLAWVFQRISPGKAANWRAKRDVLIHGKGGRTRASRSVPGGQDDLATFEVRQPTLSFKDVQGMGKLKEQLLAAVADHRQSGKNGILLSGDPGNGKTFIAEALAGQIGCSFMPISSELTSRWRGQTTEQVVKAFKEAASRAPLVLFFDEVDSYLRSRDGGDTDGESQKVVNAFLTGLMDIRESRVLVVMATNYPDRLDGAAVRPGRVDFTIKIENPDGEARTGLKNRYLPQGFTVDQEVWKRVNRRWEGFSLVRIKSALEALSKVARAGQVTAADLMAAMQETQPKYGVSLREETKTIEQLSFAPAFKDRLKGLSSRLIRIDEIEEMGGTVPKGVLFSGPPGTGKTVVAQALAKDSGWSLLATTGSELVSKESAWDELISKARAIRPCIVFIDEADSALGDRSMSGQYATLVTNKLLATLEGVTPLHDIVFIAATNNKEGMDSAALRGGRFSETFEFENPDDGTVVQIILDFMGSKPSTKFAADFNPHVIEDLMEVTLKHERSPANIRDRLQQAVNQAVTRFINGQGGKEVTLQDVKDVLMQ